MEHADVRRPYGLWWKRCAWLALIWLLGVAALGGVAFGLKLVMHIAGLTS